MRITIALQAPTVQNAFDEMWLLGEPSVANERACSIVVDVVKLTRAEDHVETSVLGSRRSSGGTRRGSVLEPGPVACHPLEEKKRKQRRRKREEGQVTVSFAMARSLDRINPDSLEWVSRVGRTISTIPAQF